METKISKNSKNPIYYNVVNATPAMIVEANKLATGNWAKVNGTSIVVHMNHIRKFEQLNQAPVVKKLDPNRCEFCGAIVETAPDGSKFCPKFCE